MKQSQSFIEYWDGWFRTWTDDRGHVWETEDDGCIDIFAYENGSCNGPRCVVCGYSFCHHCHDEPEQPCKIMEANREGA